MSKLIKLFESAKDVEEGDIFIATKFSVEGRSGTNLIPTGRTNAGTVYELKGEIDYMIRKHDYPEKMIRQIHRMLLDVVECPECDAILPQHKCWCAKVQ